ncbi:MAG: hypothetical protein SOZ62_02835 [Eubacteriales bacterium]|nr:hypothetical protein [Eubacteriales bacterium]
MLFPGGYYVLSPFAAKSSFQISAERERSPSIAFGYSPCSVSSANFFFSSSNCFISDSKKSSYKIPLSLTEKGKFVGKKIADKINYVLDKICLGLTEKGRIEFYRCLTIISDSLENCVDGIYNK